MSPCWWYTHRFIFIWIILFLFQMLSPLTNMTIDLVFLATMIGNVEHTVYIHTSRGNFPYQVCYWCIDKLLFWWFQVHTMTAIFLSLQVFGVGMANPYRLRAFVSARIPLNGTFSPYINMYNPYSEAIQVLIKLFNWLQDVC